MINLISSMLTNLGILKKINDVISGVNEHIDNKNNPHQVTAEQLGLAAAYTYQGDVDNFSSLPTQGVQKGWVYNVKAEFILNNEKYPAGTDVAWDGSKWNTLGGSLKGYIRKVNNIAPDSDSNVNIKSLIPTTIQTATDLNNIKVEGRYQCDTDSVAATLLNAPLRVSFYLDVYANNSSSTQIKQVVTANTSEMKIFMRTLVNGAWSGWQRVQFVTGVHDIQEIRNSANVPIKLTGSFSHKYKEIAGGNIDLVSNIDVYWITPATSDIGVTINLSALTKQSGYSRFITLYVDGSKCPDLRTITYTNKPSGFTLMNEPEKMMSGMVNVIGIEIVGTGNIYTITNNGGNGSSGINVRTNQGGQIMPMLTCKGNRVNAEAPLTIKQNVSSAYISSTTTEQRVYTDVVELKTTNNTAVSFNPQTVWGFSRLKETRVCVLLITGAGAPTIEWTNCKLCCEAPTKIADKATIVTFFITDTTFYLVSAMQEV